MEIKIEPFSPSFLEGVLSVEKASFSPARAPEALESELANPAAAYLVLLVGGSVCGYAGAHLALDTADIIDVAVSPEHRGRGLGRLLLRALIETLSRRGAKKIFLEVRPSNSPARALYSRAGFARISVRRNYYHDPDEEALVMELSTRAPDTRQQSAAPDLS